MGIALTNVVDTSPPDPASSIQTLPLEPLMNTFRTLATAVAASLTLATATVVHAAPETGLDAATLAAAKTPADHETAAKVFEEEAAALDKKVAFHADLAKTYGASGGKSVQNQIAKHCMVLEKEYKEAAQQNRALAALEHKLAKTATN